MVDPEDAYLLRLFPWQLGSDRYAQSQSCAASTGESWLHRAIMWRVKKSEVVDHIDGDGLNCRRVNLRITTQRRNTQNRRSARGSSSSFLGVARCGRWGWVATLRDKYLGLFANEADAAICYNYHAAHIYGEFSRLNKIDSSQYFHD